MITVVAGSRHNGVLTGTQLVGARQDRARPDHVVKREELLHGSWVDDPGYTGTLQQSLELRGDSHATRDRRDVQRLLTRSVSGDEQLAPRLIPDREGEHAVQSLREPRSPLL